MEIRYRANRPANEKNSDSETNDSEPSFDEILKNDDNQQEEEK